MTDRPKPLQQRLKKAMEIAAYFRDQGWAVTRGEYALVGIPPNGAPMPIHYGTADDPREVFLEHQAEHRDRLRYKWNQFTTECNGEVVGSWVEMEPILDQLKERGILPS